MKYLLFCLICMFCVAFGPSVVNAGARNVVRTRAKDGCKNGKCSIAATQARTSVRVRR